MCLAQGPQGSDAGEARTCCVYGSLVTLSCLKKPPTIYPSFNKELWLLANVRFQFFSLSCAEGNMQCWECLLNGPCREKTCLRGLGIPTV